MGCLGISQWIRYGGKFGGGLMAGRMGRRGEGRNSSKGLVWASKLLYVSSKGYLLHFSIIIWAPHDMQGCVDMQSFHCLGRKAALEPACGLTRLLLRPSVYRQHGLEKTDLISNSIIRMKTRSLEAESIQAECSGAFWTGIMART